MSYTNEQIKRINKTTSDFYKQVNDSFSSTRQHEWAGWNLCLPYIEDLFKALDKAKILDIACGNLRFEKFLEDNFNDISFEALLVDNSEELFNLGQLYRTNVRFNNIDIVEELLNNNLCFGNFKADLIVSFGLMHHIPTKKLREEFIKNIFDAANQKSLIIISFWQFSKDERIFNKAKKTTELAKQNNNLVNLLENDYYLCWKENKEVFRFCHNFTDDEINELKELIPTSNIKEFSADGLNNSLNKYLLCQL